MDDIRIYRAGSGYCAGSRIKKYQAVKEAVSKKEVPVPIPGLFVRSCWSGPEGRPAFDALINRNINMDQLLAIHNANEGIR